MYKTDLQKKLKKYGDNLMPRYKKILEFRLGLKDGLTHTLEETGMKFGVTRERIRQIEAKVIEQLKSLPHP